MATPRKDIQWETATNGVRIKAHGTPSAYNRGCRCPECTEVQRVRMAASRERMYAQGLPEDDPRHGRYSTYVNWGCRCEACTKAQYVVVRNYIGRTKEERRARITPDDPRHGTDTFYSYHGCRCERCTAAHTEYRRKHR